MGNFLQPNNRHPNSKVNSGFDRNRTVHKSLPPQNRHNQFKKGSSSSFRYPNKTTTPTNQTHPSNNLKTLENSLQNLPLLQDYLKVNNNIYVLTRNLRNAKHGKSPKYVQDNMHIYMPLSKFITKNNLLGKQMKVSYWKQIENTLEKPFRRTRDLEDAIKTYNVELRRFNFDVLIELERTKVVESFQIKLKNIANLALKLPDYFDNSIPILKQNKNSTIVLDQMQIACLIANGFFCTFPDRSNQRDCEKLPIFNFSNLFSSKSSEDLKLKIEKIKCLLNYFKRVLANAPNGKVSFQRKCIKESNVDWRNSTKNFTNLNVHLNGSIEVEGNQLSEVDFANKFVGGGVITSGCAQEEIRFLLSPELIASRLFTEELLDNESLIITGIEQFNSCSGYSRSFKFVSDHYDSKPKDTWGRKLSQVIAIDAINFNENENNQYAKSSIDRELNKAYSGFFYEDNYTATKPAIATGKWGCGVFKGDPYLKCLIQMMAASMAGRDLEIFTNNDQILCDKLKVFYQKLRFKNLSQIYKHMITYKPNSRENILDFIFSKIQLN